VSALRTDCPTTTAHLCCRAMSTVADLTVVVHPGETGDDLLGWAAGRLEQLEQRWSRFRPDSEISRLNAAAGTALPVSIDTLLAVHTARAAWLHTEGRFDPTVHDSLLHLGYDRTIDELRSGTPSEWAGELGAPLPAPGCAGVEVDPYTSSVRLPLGARIDLGGIGKGLAADLVARGLIERGALGALVNIGGDVRVTGIPPDGLAWHVDVLDPRTEQRFTSLEIRDGGVATSTTLRRHWHLGDRAHHHLVDPATGDSTRSPVVGVTVVAGTAAWADALSKAPFVDPDHAVGFEPAAAYVLFADGSHRTIGPMEQFERTEAR
jgi:thiamine biosynthesis lipoprotein